MNLIVERIVKSAFVNEAFDGSFVLVPLYLDVLHDYIISIPTAIYTYDESPMQPQNT